MPESKSVSNYDYDDTIAFGRHRGAGDAALLCQSSTAAAAGRQLDIVEIMYGASGEAAATLFQRRRRRRRYYRLFGDSSASAPGKVGRPGHARGRDGRFLGRIIVRDRNSGGRRQSGNGSPPKLRCKADLRFSGRHTPRRGRRRRLRLTTRQQQQQHCNTVYHGRNTITVIQYGGVGHTHARTRRIETASGTVMYGAGGLCAWQIHLLVGNSATKKFSMTSSD